MMQAPFALLHALDVAAAAVDVAHDVALKLLGNGDLDLHDRLEEDGLGLGHGMLEGENAGHAEGEFRGIDLVERTVDHAGLEIDHRIAGHDAIVGGLEDALGDGLDVLLRDGAAHDLIDDLDALPFLVGLNLDAGVAVLAATAGLADELALAVGVSR